MQSEVISSDQQTAQTPLGDRLDDTIGSTSNGIGAMISELVRRSLKAGVSDIGESLTEFAAEQVDAAVQQQMPGIAEAADAVAESTSKRVVQQAVVQLGEESAKQQQYLESKIDAAESSAVDRSTSHVEGVLSKVHESIDQTRSLAVEGNDSTQRKVEELREKGRQTWHKLKTQFSAVNEAHERLCQDHEQLRQAHTQLRENFTQVCEAHRQQSKASEERIATLLSQSQRLEERLAVLEQPRGIKGLIAKFRGGGKAASDQPARLEAEPKGRTTSEEQPED